MTFNVKVSGLRCHVSGVKCPVSGVRAQVPGCQVSGVSVKVPPSVDICRRSMNDNFFDNDRTPSPPPPLPPPPPVLAVALAGNGETGMGGAAGAAHEMDAGGGGAGLTRSFWREENGKRRVKRMRRVRRVIYMKDTYNTHTLHTVRHPRCTLYTLCTPQCTESESDRAQPAFLWNNREQQQHYPSPRSRADLVPISYAPEGRGGLLGVSIRGGRRARGGCRRRRDRLPTRRGGRPVERMRCGGGLGEQPGERAGEQRASERNLGCD